MQTQKQTMQTQNKPYIEYCASAIFGQHSPKIMENKQEN